MSAFPSFEQLEAEERGMERWSEKGDLDRGPYVLYGLNILA